MVGREKAFLNFKEARAWARSQGLGSSREFREHEAFPKNIPRNPDYVYKNSGWIDWYDFLGTVRLNRRKSPYGWRCFEEARNWARGLGLSSETEWRTFRKTKLPNDIPTNPNREYAKSGWESWADFLGTSNIKYSDVLWRSYDDVKEWARKEGIKTQSEWRERTKEENFPADIKKSPAAGYSEFTSWPDFLQNQSRMSNRGNTKWRSFRDAKKWARSVPVVSRVHWSYLASVDKIPRDIPTNVNQVYPEFSTWRDFLDFNIKGKSSKIETVLAIELSNFFDLSHQHMIVTSSGPNWLDIVCEAKSLVIEFDGSHWHKKNVQKDRKITKALMDLGWLVIRIREEPLKKISDNDLLIKRGLSEIEICKAVISHLVKSGVIHEQRLVEKAHNYLTGHSFLSLNEDFINPGWLSFEEARCFVLGLKLKSESDWRKHRKDLPTNVPRNPNQVYLSSWRGWGYWLGTGNPSPNREFLSYDEARALVRSQSIKSSREYQAYRRANPNSKLPGKPEQCYRDEGWDTWNSFTGLSRRRRK